MTIPSYTGTGLPESPLVDTWDIAEPFQAPMMTDMDYGNKRGRTRPGDEKARISFTIKFTKAQHADLLDFVRDDLGRGCSRFTMNIWNGSGMVSRTVQLFNGQIKTTTQEPFVYVAFDVLVYGAL